MAASPSAPAAPSPLVPGLVPNLRFDGIAGFLVFLIAMPLCLAIAQASNYPPIAGIWTAVIGGVVTCFLSNAQLTIKGPAAGLIVIVAGAVTGLGKDFVPELPPAVVAQITADAKSPEDAQGRLEKRLDNDRLKVGYPLALGVGVVAGVIQVGFGLLRAGKLGDFFPVAAVHGMLASIGIIIVAKQVYPVFGITPPKGAGPLDLIAALPGRFPTYNPEIALIGVVSLAILFGLPFVPFRWARRVPAPLLVLAVALPLERYFDLPDGEHTYLFHDGFFETADHEYKVGPQFLVNMPEVLKTPADQVVFTPGDGKVPPGEVVFCLPDFRGVLTGTGLQYVLMFSLIASLESLLSAKAIDLLDPYRRRTDLNRDLFACGVANTLTSLVGALPMISEIVRSKANVDNGARTKYANLFHAVFLLGFVLAVPNLIREIPLAALGAMLVFTGYRLAHPREFAATLRVGPEQLGVFVATIGATLATDLLIGILVGIALELGLAVAFGAPVYRLFAADVVEVRENPDPAAAVVAVRGAAVFSNWLSLKPKLVAAAAGKAKLVVDLSDARLVDHTAMEKLHELERELGETGTHLEVVGLAGHTPLSGHPRAMHRRSGTDTPAAVRG